MVGLGTILLLCTTKLNLGWRNFFQGKLLMPTKFDLDSHACSIVHPLYVSEVGHKVVVLNPTLLAKLFS